MFCIILAQHIVRLLLTEVDFLYMVHKPYPQKSRLRLTQLFSLLEAPALFLSISGVLPFKEKTLIKTEKYFQQKVSCVSPPQLKLKSMGLDLHSHSKGKCLLGKSWVTWNSFGLLQHSLGTHSFEELNRTPRLESTQLIQGI